MTKPFKGIVNLDIRDSTPDWEPYEQPKAPEGTPNVLYIVWDDVGFAAMEPFGGLIETPTMNRLAQAGLTYTNWHTTALCSPTRSCLMTGRNHTTNGMACISEAAIGFPNANGHIPFECANIAEVLSERGFNTYMLGKWHLCAEDEMNMASNKRNWPVGRGFERFYGFLGAETNNWYPDLVHDNHPVEQPSSPTEDGSEKGYHLSADLADKALEFIKDAKAVAPERPFFMYFCPGACHAPHHAPKEWADRYKGKFDMGYERYRELVLERQKQMGIFPENTALSPINPIGTPAETKSSTGVPYPALDYVKPWDALPEDEKQLYRRMAEVYAGFLSHTDHQIGRIIDYLEESGQLDNTLVIVVSDNGASGEGGPTGSVNECKFMNGIPDSLEENLKYLDVLGSPLTYNHYPTGWAMAFNTPFKMWKRYSYNGGICDPLIMSWPKGIKGKGEVRHQYHHAIDIVPTILDVVGIEAPEAVKGYTQHPIEGVSMRSSFDNAQVSSNRETQYYSMLGTRGIWHQGWKAVTTHPAISGWSNYDKDTWELYHTAEDRSESQNLAEQYPDKLQELINLWFFEAGKYQGFPLDDRVAVEILLTPRPKMTKPRERYVYYPNTAEVPEAAAVSIINHSYAIRAEVEIAASGAEGVVFAHGSRFGGHALYVKNGTLHYVYNFVGSFEQKISSSKPVPTGASTLSAIFTKEGENPPHVANGTLAIYINDEKVGEGKIRTQPSRFSIAGEGLNVGRDGGEPVTGDYPGEYPWPFTGTVKRVVVDVSGEGSIHLEREAHGMLMRD
ncbi:MAG: arylsulfatase [Chloroflexi bacterium]|nr:MAG: arylsulfatase [Chloroflexota bacterium]